jgi:hypothetical protein
VTATVVERSFRGEPALELRAGELRATFVPGIGMTGVSLRQRGREYLALPGGLDALRAGHTAGLPLLAPWANRLGAWRYRAAGVSVDLRGLPLRTDDAGLPIHGLLVGDPGWRVTRSAAKGGVARVAASVDVDAPAFPFPHRIDVAIAAHDDRLVVDTTIVPTGSHSRPPTAPPSSCVRGRPTRSPRCGCAGPAVRRARADGCTDRRAGTRRSTSRHAGRRLLRPVRAAADGRAERSTPLRRPALRAPLRCSPSC